MSEEKKDFKIGDKVKVLLAGDTDFNNEDDYELGTIERISDDLGYYIEFDDNRFNSCYYGKEQLQKIEEDVKKNEEDTKKRFDELYYETRENEMDIMNKISKILNNHIFDLTRVDTFEKLSNIYKNLKG